MALSAARNTPAMGPIKQRLSLKMAATTIYAGSIVMIDAGYAKPGATASSKLAAGRAAETKTNSGSAGDESIDVEEGIFLFDNDSGDALTQAEAGALCYIKDDATVCKTSTSKSAAGRFLGFVGTQAMVRMHIGVS